MFFCFVATCMLYWPSSSDTKVNESNMPVSDRRVLLRRIRTYFPPFPKSSLFISTQLVPLTFKLSTCYFLSKLLPFYCTYTIHMVMVKLHPVVASMICISSFLVIYIPHSRLSRACVSPYAQFGGPDGYSCICRHDDGTKL